MDQLSRIERVVRFALPYWVSVVVVNAGSEAMPHLEGRKARQFDHGDEGRDDSRVGHEAIARLERLRSEDWEFLLVPSTAFEWVEDRPAFAQHLNANFRLVARDDDACAIYAIGDDWSGEDTADPAPDGLPLPPPEMIGLVSGPIEPGLFYKNGALGAKCVRDALSTQRLAPQDFESILDFGCGCGRVFRHWKNLDGPALHGSDYNPYLIDWCRRNLPFASFGVNGLRPGLDHPDSSFDFIYTLSIFTHLDETLQEPWIVELGRLLKPGGILLLTVHGENTTGYLPDTERERFKAGELVVLESELSGSSSCAVFHPDEYIRRKLAKDLELLDILPEAARDLGGQTTVLVRKPAQSSERPRG
jgi:SAM-dependent methyltransferase